MPRLNPILRPAVERDEALHAANVLEAQTREAAAARRFSTSGELESYLRWRLSCRSGELLLLDAYLFGVRTTEFWSS